jgi:HK97 family phage prohead protease
VSELRRLTAPAEWKTIGDAGELEGYMSVFGNVDQGGDVVQRGAFRKSFSDWNRAKSPMPLIADHVLSTDGVIGSVTHMVEDSYGAKIQARFSSVPKAQDIRTKMVEGHLNGLSFTYEPIRFHFGEQDGRRVRFLDEVKAFEATVTPFPMNQLALASAKRDPADHADAERRLRELEAWAAATTATDALRHEVENPAAAMHALGVLQDAKARQQLARLEAWAASQPPGPPLARLSVSVPRTGWRRPTRTATRWRGGWPTWCRASTAAACRAAARTPADLRVRALVLLMADRRPAWSHRTRRMDGRPAPLFRSGRSAHLYRPAPLAADPVLKVLAATP